MFHRKPDDDKDITHNSPHVFSAGLTQFEDLSLPFVWQKQIFSRVSLLCVSPLEPHPHDEGDADGGGGGVGDEPDGGAGWSWQDPRKD